MYYQKPTTRSKCCGSSTRRVQLINKVLGFRTGNQNSSSLDKKVSKLGALPHQVRGFFSSFGNVLVQGPAFEQCTACSFRVVTKVKEEGFPTLLRVFNEPDYLEKLAGLDQLQKEVDLDDLDLDWDEE